MLVRNTCVDGWNFTRLLSVLNGVQSPMPGDQLVMWNHRQDHDDSADWQSKELNDECQSMRSAPLKKPWKRHGQIRTMKEAIWNAVTLSLIKALTTQGWLAGTQIASLHFAKPLERMHDSWCSSMPCARGEGRGNSWLVFNSGVVKVRADFFAQLQWWKSLAVYASPGIWQRINEPTEKMLDE